MIIYINIFIGIKIYNYNKNSESTDRGIKEISITGDNCYITPIKGYL